MWPAEIKRQSVTFWNENEAPDDDNFVWFCPERCKSMPYFDIKLSWNYWHRTEWAPKGQIGTARYEGTWNWKDDHVIWKGNRDYRSGFPDDLQTNLPAPVDIAHPKPANVAITSPAFWTYKWLNIPTDRVSSVGTCRVNKNKANKIAHDEKCWPFKTELNGLFPNEAAYNGGTPKDASLSDCCQPVNGAVCKDSLACVRVPVRAGVIVVAPAYKFYAGAVARPAQTRTCTAVRYADVAIKSADIDARKGVINKYWSSPQTFTRDSLKWKSLRDEEWTEDNGERKKIPGWQDEYLDVYHGDKETKCENHRKYEWMCYDVTCNDYKTNCYTSSHYYEARLYESMCESAACEDFASQSCYANAYSFAVHGCGWQTAASSHDGGWLTLTALTDPEFAAFMRSYGDGRYVAAIPAQMELTVRDAASAWDGTSALELGPLTDFKITLKSEFSCKMCEHAQEVKGVVSQTGWLEKADEIVKCRACKPYEVLLDHSCKACQPGQAYHRIRSPLDRTSCVNCPALKPMRRVLLDEDCKECQVLDYFSGSDPSGCLRLMSVMDGRTAAGIQGVDEYYSEGKPRAVMPKMYRVVQAQTGWLDAVIESQCAHKTYAVARATELSYRRWCGHREIVREQQALLAVGNTSYLYRAENTTAGLAAIGDVCGATLQATTSGLFDLQCTDNRSNALSISVVRSGHPQKCAVCLGSQYTRQCWPTYHPDLASEEAAYFQSTERLSSPGTCAQCAGQCLLPNQYMQPAPFTCMWNGSADGRMLGVVSALPTTGLWYWYKQSPCAPCLDVNLNTTHAVQIKQCGNKRTYRTWDALQTVPVEKRSIPLTQTCCSTKKAGVDKECTESEHSSWIDENCKDALELEDVAPVKETYCPPGWYVDQACAEGTPAAWAPDCCKRCGGCSGGMFRTESYATCTGATYIDTEQNGCEQSCLSNSYKKDGNCYRCESCSTTGTGEHGRESV